MIITDISDNYTIATRQGGETDKAKMRYGYNGPIVDCNMFSKFYIVH
jgi:hypothetical protein